MCAYENGTVYIGTNKGLILFYLPSYRTEFKPKAVIENILVLERSVHKASSKFFRHDENFFRFR